MLTRRHFLVSGAAAAAMRAIPAVAQQTTIPNGHAIVYHQDGHVWTMREDGSDPRVLIQGPPPSRGAWEHVAISHDRRWLAANEHLPNPAEVPGAMSRVWIFDLVKRRWKRAAPALYSAGNGGVSWGPDGYLYFQGMLTVPYPNPVTAEQFAADSRMSDLWRCRYDGAGVVRLFEDPAGAIFDVGVAHNGSILTYVRHMLRADYSGFTELWRARLDGTDRRRMLVTGTVGVDSAHDPEPSPDGLYVAFSRVNSTVSPNWPEHPLANTAHDLWLMTADGVVEHRMTEPGPISIVPNWKPQHPLRIVYADKADDTSYLGASVIDSAQAEQAPIRLLPGPDMPKWIP
jgi:hypothetical protein